MVNYTERDLILRKNCCHSRGKYLRIFKNHKLVELVLTKMQTCYVTEIFMLHFWYSDINHPITWNFFRHHSHNKSPSCIFNKNEENFKSYLRFVPFSVPILWLYPYAILQFLHICYKWHLIVNWKSNKPCHYNNW